MNDNLTIDEFNALELISKLRKGDTPNACIGRNSKRLNGLKFIKHHKDGTFEMTEKGLQTLFVKRCIEGLRLVSQDTNTTLAKDVATFLSKKGHIAESPEGGFAITDKGRDSLVDIDSAPAVRV
ncbi:hypothetical protein [Undibacterium sp. Xuan67W]|uniref:hypothetical protein n=1 Tax=Undibacterium sp. Xuan67W TaxID=3413057 RepID=UPI003BF294CC